MAATESNRTKALTLDSDWLELPQQRLTEFALILLVSKVLDPQRVARQVVTGKFIRLEWLASLQV